MLLGYSDLMTAPGGRYLAWTEDGELFAALAPSFEPRRLAGTKGKLPVSEAWPSPDGRRIFYLQAREAPVPHEADSDSDPDAQVDTMRRQLWLVDVHTGAAQQLTQGETIPFASPVFAPDSRSFVTTEGTMLYEYRIEREGLKRRALLKNDPQHQAAKELSGVAYSPDGRRLAFVSARKGGQSYIGLIDLEGMQAHYLDPGIYRDFSPVWSPSGSELVFVRSPGNWTREYRFSTVNEGAPWSLMVANADDGRVRALWRADSGKGSVFVSYGNGAWMQPKGDEAQLIWTPSGQILFPWEKTGWISTYVIPSHGGDVRHLTPGEGEVTQPELSADGRSLLYATNVGDLPRLHLWQVALEAGRPKQLTSGKGVEHSPRMLDSGDLVYISNVNGRLPNRRTVQRPGGQRIELVSDPQSERRLRQVWRQFIDQETVPVRAADGVVSYHLITVPSGPVTSGGFPVIVHSKGGPDGRISPGYAGIRLAQYAARRGYVFVDMNYRGCFGFGLDYRFPEGRGATGGSEVKDLEALAHYLGKRPDVNARRIGIIGGSYGGHLVGLALSRLPQYFAAGVHAVGVSDWVIEMKKDQEEGWPSAPPPFIRLSERVRIEDLAFESSPPAHIAKWRAPTLITAGELDKQGHMESIIDLGYRLLEQGTPVEFYIDPAGGHDNAPPEKVFEFFERELRRND